jgi:6-phosphogluconate dehydrogenase
MNQQEQCDIGMIGLGVMGANLVLNMVDHGFSVAGFDKAQDQVESLQKQTTTSKVQTTDNLETFLNSLKSPKSVMLMVPHGHVVDALIDELIPLLNAGDIIIDGGNSHFTETNRRQTMLEEKGLQFLGVGVSGGEEGARHGPSIMPGGPKTGYDHISPIFEAIAAQVDGQPCVSYLGAGSAGHYVKMVHNGIEYGIMQLIAETYDLMKTALDLSDEELHTIYADWNKSPLNGFLVEITADIFERSDNGSGSHLVDMILDVAQQNNTGLWTSQDAMALQVPTPNIDVAVVMRNMSTLKQERQQASQLLPRHTPQVKEEQQKLVQQTKNALYMGMLITYAQGMALLKKAADTYGYHFNLEEVALIWRGGCIIRAEVLNQIATVYREHPELPNFLLDTGFVKALLQHESDLRAVIHAAVSASVPAPGLMASLGYFDAYRRSWLPANLIQAQRDYFGAHTYERIDKQGVFHTQWTP